MTIKIIDETTDFKELPCRPLDDIIDRIWLEGTGCKKITMANGGTIEWVKTPLRKSFVSSLYDNTMEEL